MLRCLGALAAASGAAAAALLERERGGRSGLQVRMPRRHGVGFLLVLRSHASSCCSLERGLRACALTAASALP